MRASLCLCSASGLLWPVRLLSLPLLLLHGCFGPSACCRTVRSDQCLLNELCKFSFHFCFGFFFFFNSVFCYFVRSFLRFFLGCFYFVACAFAYFARRLRLPMLRCSSSFSFHSARRAFALKVLSLLLLLFCVTVVAASVSARSPAALRCFCFAFAAAAALLLIDFWRTKKFYI